MKTRTHFLVAVVLGAVLFAVACGKDEAAEQQAQERAAIQAALMKYLNERGTVNVAAMNIDVQDVKVSGDRADVQVLFRTKQGEGEMRIAYVLLRQQGAWAVQAQPRSDMPHAGIPAPQGATEMPAGHPPVTTPTQPPVPPAKKP